MARRAACHGRWTRRNEGGDDAEDTILTRWRRVGDRVVASGSGRARGTTVVVVIVIVVDRRNAKTTTGLGFRFARAMKDGDDLDHVVADSHAPNDESAIDPHPLHSPSQV